MKSKIQEVQEIQEIQEIQEKCVWKYIVENVWCYTLQYKLNFWTKYGDLKQCVFPNQIIISNHFTEDQKLGNKTFLVIFKHCAKQENLQE